MNFTQQAEKELNYREILEDLEKQKLCFLFETKKNLQELDDLINQIKEILISE